MSKKILINQIGDNLTKFLTNPASTPTSIHVNTNQLSGATKAELDSAIADVRPYKVYTALLSQTGTSAPTAVILENTFPSAIVWAFSSAGSYVGTLTAAFVENKTQCWIEQSSTDIATGTSFKRIVRTGANTVQIDCSDGEGNPHNDVIVDTPIEIRVYN